MTYTLDDGEALHAAAPATFEIPPKELRENLKPNTHAKLVFLTKEGRGERMWVKVIRRFTIDEKIVYTGLLANDPAVVEARAGDDVTFEPKHVVSTIPEEYDEHAHA